MVASAGNDDRTDPTKPKEQKWESTTAADGVCESFMQKRNADEPGADDLLGPAPAVPTTAVSESEADHIQTDFFLRDPDLRIVAIRPTPVPNQYRFVTKSSVKSPRLEVRHGNDTSSEQRMMNKPDLYVEVRDGKIFGVRATVQRK